MSLFSKKNQEPKIVSLYIHSLADDNKHNPEYYDGVKYIPSELAHLLNDVGFVLAKGYDEKIEHRCGDYYSSTELRYVDDNRPLTTYYDAALWLFNKKEMFIEITAKEEPDNYDIYTYTVKDRYTGKTLFVPMDSDGDVKMFDLGVEEIQNDAILECCKYLLDGQKHYDITLKFKNKWTHTFFPQRNFSHC